jgi:hypothetical protein
VYNGDLIAVSRLEVLTGAIRNWILLQTGTVNPIEATDKLIYFGHLPLQQV